MFKKWADKLRNDRRMHSSDDSSALIQQLRSYPPLLQPFTGPPLSLSEKQVTSNLNYILESIPERLGALRSLLKQTSQAIDWPDIFTDPAITEPFVKALHQWAGEHWPALRQTMTGNAEARWLAGERTGDNIAFSLVADVTLTLGELIRSQRPSLNWGVDLDPRNRKDNMDTVNRVMLLGNWREDPAKQIEIDIEATIVNRLLNPNDTSEKYENTWLRLVQGAIDGGYEGVGVVDDFP